MMQLAAFPVATFGGALATLEPELDAMLNSALTAGEDVRLSVQSAPGEALVVTRLRVLVLKGAARSTTGRGFGRYFAFDEIVRFERRGLLGTNFVAVVTPATQLEPIPLFARWRCTFGVTFAGTSGGPTSDYLRDLEGWLIARRRTLLLYGALPTILPVGVAVQRGESFHLQGPATYFEEKTIRQYSGRSSGISVPVVSGVRVRVGRSHGTSWNTQVLAEDDRGSLLVGSRRVVFVGARRTLSIPLHAIATVEAFRDGMHVGVANKPKAVFRTDDDLPGLVLKRVLGIP